jgi:hypothetical protein
MTPARPVPKILFGKLPDRRRIEPKRPRGINCPTRGACVTGGIGGQNAAQRFKMSSIAEIGWSIGGMNRAFDTSDGRVPDQPKKAFPFHPLLSENR